MSVILTNPPKVIQDGPKRFGPELAIPLIELGIKYVPELIVAIANLFHPGATIDDAIAALDAAKKKSYDDYIAAAGGPPDAPVDPAVSLLPTEPS